MRHTSDDTEFQARLCGGYAQANSGQVTHPPSTQNGAKAGRQLLSLIGSGRGEEGVQEDRHEQQDFEECRPLQLWTNEDTGPSASSPMHLNVVLEDMLEAQGPWDQFEVNEKNFDVKSSFQEDLSQYTTKLQVSKIPSEVRHEAERIAAEIENELKVSGRLADAYECTAAAEGDEESQFSAVSRQIVQMQ